MNDSVLYYDKCIKIVPELYWKLLISVIISLIFYLLKSCKSSGYFEL